MIFHLSSWSHLLFPIAELFSQKGMHHEPSRPPRSDPALFTGDHAASRIFRTGMQKKYTAAETRSHFHQPPKWFAPHAFWFWDAPLNPDSAASMAQEMTRQGLNPGYAHARHSGGPLQPFSLPSCGTMAVAALVHKLWRSDGASGSSGHDPWLLR
jgi:hypothetical protein